ncbi:MAG: hypothetical protein ACYC2E_11915 [Sulfuricella sp.]
MHRKKWLLPAPCLASTASAGTAAEEGVVRRQSAPQSQGVLFATSLLSEIEQADYRSRIRTATDVLPGIDMIYGRLLMTEEEKAAFRCKLRRAKSDEARQGDTCRARSTDAAARQRKGHDAAPVGLGRRM